MPLKTITSFPPGGFTYTQPETNLRFGQIIPLPDQAKLVSSHRKANGLPNSSIDESAFDIEEWTCLRLNNDPEWCITDVQKKTALRQFGKLLVQGAQAVAESVSKAVLGARILYEWWGEGGKPVDQETAQKRADCCISCPQNDTGRSILSSLSEAAHEQLEKRSELKMSVEGESHLGVCLVCHCPMKLKVHTPISLISQHTTIGDMQKLDLVPGACWVRDEIRNQNRTNL